MLARTGLFLALLALLNSCYCVRVTYDRVGNAHPRWLGNINVQPRYELCFGNGNANQLHLYTGFPSDLEKKLEKEYKTPQTTNYSFENKGLFGARYEHYISPGFIPYRILGLGLDYSYSRTMLNYQENNFTNQLSFTANRIAVSMNFMTLVTQFGLIGYATGQIGLVNYSRDYSGNNPNFSFGNFPDSGGPDYRIGYGFEYFPMENFGFTLEGGYGRGAYGRAGVVLSF